MTAHTEIRADRDLPDVFNAFIAAQTAIVETGLEPALRHLVVLRASQINGCAFCVKMHTREARADGETNDRLDRLVAWRHMQDFSTREKAAFAWTEALTVIDPAAGLEPLRAELARHFEPREIAALTALIAMINLWNRMQVAQH